MTPTPELRVSLHNIPGERLALVAWDADGREAFRVALPVAQAMDLAAGLVAGARARLPGEAGP
jgi:hypothetical protein